MFFFTCAFVFHAPSIRFTDRDKSKTYLFSRFCPCTTLDGWSSNHSKEIYGCLAQFSHVQTWFGLLALVSIASSKSLPHLWQLGNFSRAILDEACSSVSKLVSIIHRQFVRQLTTSYISLSAAEGEKSICRKNPTTLNSSSFLFLAMFFAQGSLVLSFETAIRTSFTV